MSPFASLGTTHFARWAVIDQPVYEGPPQKPDALRSQYLLFDSCLDGDRDEYLESIRTLMSAHADAVWEHCVGYPGSSDAEGFADYFRRNQIDASLFMAAYPKATVQDVRVSLALRQRIIDFAVATQELDAQTLLASYREVLMSGIAVSSGAAESS